MKHTTTNSKNFKTKLLVLTDINKVHTAIVEANENKKI